MRDKKRRLVRSLDQCHAIRIPDEMILVTLQPLISLPFDCLRLHALQPAGTISKQLSVLTSASEPLCKVQSSLIPLGGGSHSSVEGGSLWIVLVGEPPQAHLS